MWMGNWLDNIIKAEKTCIIHDGKRKVHYKFVNEEEMVEEYSEETHVLLQRAWKVKKPIGGGDDEWNVEIGDPVPALQQPSIDTLGIRESSDAPVVSRRITKSSLEWRIRNLPYPLETYSVSADPENHCITVRTTNKKYYKKLAVPDLDRISLLPVQNRIQFAHKFNTLIISYQKPPELLQLENKVYEEIKKLKPSKAGDLGAGCNPS